MSTETIITHAGRLHRRPRARQRRRRRCRSPIPGTGQVFAEVPAGTEPTSTRRSGAARGALDEWSALAVSKRGEILGQAAHHVEQHLDELIPLLTREQGKTLRDARIEITKAIDTLMHYVGLSKALRGAHTPNLDPGVDGIVLRRPLGVVGAIVPWNFPTTLLCNKLAPALVAGNTVVAKPAGTTPLTTLRFAELLAEGGLPPGRLQRRHRQRLGDRHRAGHASRASARSPSRARPRSASRSWPSPPAARKRVTLELGGSDPMIICDDADLDAAASAASMGRFYNCGQACLAIKRVYVFEAVADEVIEQITAKAKRLKVGRGDVKGSQMGPLHTRAQRDEVADQVRRTLAMGGTLATGGRRPSDPELADGFFYMPTVVVDPAARRADGDRGGLRSGAADLARTRSRRGDRRARTPRRSVSAPRSGHATCSARAAAAERIEAGYTWINSRTKVYDELPFGGWKSSGYGKEHGEEAFDFYTETQVGRVRQSGLTTEPRLSTG